MAAVGGTDEVRADISEDEKKPAAATPEEETDAGRAARDGASGDVPDEQPGEEPDDEPRTGMTPRQARRVRAVVSAVVMAAVAVALVVRMEYGLSLVMVGLYGVALILCGIAVGLSRRGRTRVATAVLVAGFAVVAAAEWLTPTAV
jgi:hypothetical protein